MAKVENTPEAIAAALEAIAAITLSAEQAAELAKPNAAERAYQMVALDSLPSGDVKDANTREYALWLLQRGSVVEFGAVPGVEFEIVAKSAGTLWVRPFTGERLLATSKSDVRKDSPGVVTVPVSDLTHVARRS